MKRDKFLTVFAVFDDSTQALLQSWQDDIFASGLVGTQTMGIPFHISLGSFPTNMEEELEERIKKVCESTCEFPLSLTKINDFGNKVLFLEPEENNELLRLHNLFDNNYANGFPFHAHATIFCGETQDVEKAKLILSGNFSPLQTKIVGIQMGEFFPTRMIVRELFTKN